MRGTWNQQSGLRAGAITARPGSRTQITGRSVRILPEIAVRAVRGRENLAIDNRRRTPSSARASYGIAHADLINLYAKGTHRRTNSYVPILDLYPRHAISVSRSVFGPCSRPVEKYPPYLLAGTTS